MNKLSDYQKAKKWLESYEWDRDPEADGNIATIYYALQEVERHENMKTKGLLLKLPCKVGETVYIIYKKEIIKGIVFKYVRGPGGIGLDIEQTENCDPPIHYGKCIEDFGKTIFLSNREAGEALSKMGKGGTSL